VPRAGLEPARRLKAATDFKSVVSTNSTISAYQENIIPFIRSTFNVGHPFSTPSPPYKKELSIEEEGGGLYNEYNLKERRSWLI
jgi:hypothetical protein